MQLFFLADFATFLGRFHPLVVHLPIGILLLALLLEVLAARERFSGLRQAVPPTLLIGTLSAVLAVILGLLLADEGGYDQGLLGKHQWFGIAVTVVSAIAWALSSGKLKVPNRVYLGSLVLTGLLLAATGHFGGSLTHGENYLWRYAPGFIQKLAGVEEKASLDSLQVSHPDSAVVFVELIQPVLTEKCVSCHGESKQNGGLRLTHPEAIDEGGDGGPVLVAGAPRESELYHRLTLSQNKDKFMPPSGLPMTYNEVRLLDWWIAQGADYEDMIMDMDIPEDIAILLEEQYGWSRKKPSFVELIEVEPLTAEARRKVEEAGFRAEALSANNNLLEITPVSGNDTIDRSRLEVLLEAADQITWLNLGGTGIRDEWLPILSDMPHLTRLRLERNPITDAGIRSLSSLEHLESLNLYGTEITDAGLEQIGKMKALQRLFLWQTAVSKEAVERLQQKHEDLKIDTGFRFAEAEKENQ